MSGKSLWCASLFEILSVHSDTSAHVYPRELRDSQVSVFVHCNGVARVAFVVVVHVIQVGLEDGVSSVELIVGIRLLVLLHPKGEG